MPNDGEPKCFWERLMDGERPSFGCRVQLESAAAALSLEKEDAAKAKAPPVVVADTTGFTMKSGDGDITVKRLRGVSGVGAGGGNKLGCNVRAERHHSQRARFSIFMSSCANRSRSAQPV